MSLRHVGSPYARVPVGFHLQIWALPPRGYTDSDVWPGVEFMDHGLVLSGQDALPNIRAFRWRRTKRRAKLCKQFLGGETALSHCLIAIIFVNSAALGSGRLPTFVNLHAAGRTPLTRG
jgi:hypothetical protein